MMHRWVYSRGTILLFSVSLLGGCGGGGGVTSIAPTKKLMTLSAAESAQLCTDTSNYLAHSLMGSDGCKLIGLEQAATLYARDPTLSDADLQQDCANAAAKCMPSGSTGTCDIGNLATCSANAVVSDVTKCATDDVAAVNAAIAGLPACSALTQAWLNSNPNIVGTVATPATCTALQTACPDINPPLQ